MSENIIVNETKKNSVLIVDDESLNIMVLTRILNSDYTILAVKNGLTAIKVAEKQQPDVILLDIMMPEMDGYTVAKMLKSSDKTRSIPIIFITGLSSNADEEKGLSLGAADYIIKPFSSAIVKLRVQNQIKIVEQFRLIEKLSLYDQLTSIPNRRAFCKRMEMEWNRAAREKQPISILIMDVDKFKAYNDTYGHQQGDAVLKTVAETLTSSFDRSADFVARWGGEEFVALLPSTELSGALYIAEKARQNISDTVIPCTDGNVTKVTISIGVNTIVPKNDSSCEEFLEKADKALYKAKESGRNKVCEAV